MQLATLGAYAPHDERQMRAVLKRTTVADLRDGVSTKTPAAFAARKSDWFAERRQGRMAPAGRKNQKYKEKS